MLARLAVELARRFGTAAGLRRPPPRPRHLGGHGDGPAATPGRPAPPAQLRVHSVSSAATARWSPATFPRRSHVDRSIGRPRPGRPAGGARPGNRRSAGASRPFGRSSGSASTTLVEADLGTGRTHQVRVHLSYLGHPVLGDPIYGGPRTDPVQASRASPCTPPTSASSTRRTGARLSFDAPLPADLAAGHRSAPARPGSEPRSYRRRGQAPPGRRRKRSGHAAASPA